MLGFVDQLPLIIDGGFPENFYILHDPATGRYGAYIRGSANGIACFKQQENAESFKDLVKGYTRRLMLIDVTFDKARDIAKQRPTINSLILLDDMNNPEVHWVE